MAAKLQERTTKGHHEPIGPSSHPISLRNFLESARANVSHWRQTDISPDITAKYLDGLSEEQQTALVDRCSCGDLREQNQTAFADDGLLTDLKLWQWVRYYCGSDDPERLNQAVTESNAAPAKKAEEKKSTSTRKGKAAAAAAQAALEEESMDIMIDPSLQASPGPLLSPSVDGPVASTSKELLDPLLNPVTGKRKRAPPVQIVEPAINAKAVDPIKEKILSSGLKSYQTFYEASAYLRKTRQSDYQSLSHLRVSTAPEQFMFRESAPMPTATGHEPELVITVSFQPIPNKFTTRDKDNQIVASRLQRSVFLGSQTLGTLRDSLVCASAAVPQEKDSNANEIPVGNAAAEHLLADLMETDPTVYTDKWRFLDKKWIAGSVIMMDGKLYSDQRHSVQDYAQQVADAVANQQWPTRHGETTDSSMQVDEQDIMLNNSVNTFGMPHPEIDPSLPGMNLNGHDNSNPRLRSIQPSYQNTGKSLHSCTFYDILEGIKLNEPYWMMHHGNCEHVFVFEEIRLLHASDPPPIMPSEDGQGVMSPYPVTIFLSRLNVNKCNVCERDPATRVTVNDDLAGVSPCPICDECFRLLHGDVESAKAAGIEIIPILEELET